MSVMPDNINMEKELEIYIDEKGEQPYTEWLESLDKSIQARIDNRMNRVEEGNYGDYSHLGEGIFELRFHFGSGYRVYCGEYGTNIVLLLSGGNKSDQSADIQKAKY